MHTDVDLMPTENCNISSLRYQICVSISLRHNAMADRQVQHIPLSPFIKNLLSVSAPRGPVFRWYPLTLARTSYFAILHRTWGGGTIPRLVIPLIEIELRNKDKRKDRDVLNLTIPDFTTLGDILTFPGQVKQKNAAFLRRSSFWQIIFELRTIEKNTKRHRVPLVKAHRNM